MSATIALQSAVVGRLSEDGSLSGVFHDAPARSGFPFAVVDCSDERDWSCKDRQGREIALQVVLWDDQPSRLLTLENDVESKLATLPVENGWHLSSLLLTGKQRSCDPGRPWSRTLQWRARLIEHREGTAS